LDTKSSIKSGSAAFQDQEKSSKFFCLNVLKSLN